MKIINKSNYILLQSTDTKSVGEFIKSASHQILQQSQENYVVDLLGFADINKQNIKQLRSIYDSILAENYSFVVLINQLKVDELPEEINTVPTLKEAEDVIQMEMIERDLGF